MRAELLHSADACRAPPNGSGGGASLAYAHTLLRGGAGGSAESGTDATAEATDADADTAATAATAATATDAASADERAWERLRIAFDGHLARVTQAIRLSPSDFAVDASTWTAGGLVGSVEGYTSPFAPWAVRYANEKEGGGSASAGLNVWLTPRLAAPHLSVYVGVRGGVATFMADALPRRDLASHPDDVRRFYTGGGAACACAACSRPPDQLIDPQHSPHSRRPLAALAAHAIYARPFSITGVERRCKRRVWPQGCAALAPVTRRCGRCRGRMRSA